MKSPDLCLQDSCTGCARGLTYVPNIALLEWAPELPRGLGYGLAAKADVIGYSTASKEDGGYYISFEAYDERVVGSRLRPLAQKVLPFNYDAITKEILSYKEEE